VTPYLPGKRAASAKAAPAPAVEHKFDIEVSGPERAPQPTIQEFEIPPTDAEIDISGDWDAHAEPAETKAFEGVPSDLVEEIEFYLGQGLTEEAEVAIKKVADVAPNFSKLPDWRARLKSGAAVEAAPVAAKPADEQGLGGFVSDLEDALGDDFNVGGAQAKPAAPIAGPIPVAKPAPAPIARPAAAASAAPAPKAEEPPAVDLFSADSGAVDMLGDLFAEFKEDVEEGATDYGDPYTHYNLGMAFKEMGLMDEAIGELQKVCQATEHGVPFSQTFQAYTWLAHCLIEKGVPDAAYRWYEKALTIAPDGETRVAIHYELGCAYETAGRKPQALQHFMEVYGTNIDYRDVAERIKAVRS
jgi:hypothetical protein